MHVSPKSSSAVSELLTNVIAHVGEGAPVSLRLNHIAEGRTRLAVTDTDPHGWLVLHRPDGDGESGRGLLLLDSVAVRWGVHREPGGKTVWCELHGEG